MLLFSLSILLLSSQSVGGLKILAYNPVFGHSHANFLGKIADILSEAGHEVVMLNSIVHTGLLNRTSQHARIIFVPPNDFVTDFGPIQQTMMGSTLWTADNGNILSMREPLRHWSLYMGSQCETVLTTPGLIEQLKAEKFDVAFSEAVDYCGFGLFHLLGIEKFATTQSVSNMDDAVAITGAPSFPSYVPALMSLFGDRMTMTERAINMFNTYYYHNMLEIMNYDSMEAYKRLHPELPALEEIIAKSSYFFMNSEPLIDFPRVVTRKIVDIGGISVPTDRKPLEEPFDSLLSARPRAVFISFGSIMQSQHMPAHFKQSILAAAKHFKDVNFIWKYEKPEDGVADGIENLHAVKWAPQHDLLTDPRLTAFVTHGGLGSINEATLTGVQMLAIPVMGDQMRNGKMVERIGNGVHVHKEVLAKPDQLIAALHKLLDTDEYAKRALQVAAMIADQPQSPKDRLVSHFEFMAKYGPLTELNHVGSELGTIKLYNLDIFAILALAIITAISVIIFVIVRVVRLISKCMMVVKRKAD